MFSRTTLLVSRISGRCLPKMDYSVIKMKDNSLCRLFFDRRTQLLMKKLTEVDYDVVFKPRLQGQKLRAPFYKLLTNEELEEEQRKAAQKAEILLQVPPILDVPDDKVEILSEDKTLDGHDTSHAKIVFTDVSTDLHAMERTVVVREPNGILRTATQAEKKRMNQVYFPAEGRELTTPKMFEGKYFEDVLNRREYIFILDRACLQFDPDEEDYHTIISCTYDRIDSLMEFNALRSTRHFGSMAFYLALQKKLHNLMKHFLRERKILEASYLIHLYRVLHGEAKSEILDLDLENQDAALKTVEEFVMEPSNQMLSVVPDLDDYIAFMKDQQEMREGVKQASGV